MTHNGDRCLLLLGSFTHLTVFNISVSLADDYRERENVIRWFGLLFILTCITLNHTSVLEGSYPAEICSNFNQTHMNKLINVFRITKIIGRFFIIYQVGAKLCRTASLQDQYCLSCIKLQFFR